MAKKFFIYTFGCRLNQAESNLIRGKLKQQGWQEAAPEEADYIFINSCAVTQKAAKEVAQYVRHCRRHYPQAKIWLLGCFVDSLRVAGRPFDLPADRFLTNKEKRQWIGETIPPAQGRNLLKIQDGCNQFCSYCLVPYLRGRSRSIPVTTILEQARQLEQHGARWLVLTGVDIIQYRDSETGFDFVALVTRLLRKTRLFLSFGSLSPLIGQPRLLPRFLALYHRYPQRLAPHLHLSLQSGSDKILQLMRRPYRQAFYWQTIQKLRAIPRLNLTTDIIVGFPGETDADFQASCDFARRAKFGKIHIFRYSPRPGTLAAKMGPKWGLVPENIKKARAQQLARLEQRLRHQFWQQFLGQKLPVFFFSPHQGQTANFIPIASHHPQLTNQFQLRRLTQISDEKVWLD